MLLEKNPRTQTPEPQRAAQPVAVRAAPTADAAVPARILIVADDLTGACDSAAAFVAAGHGVRVLLNHGDRGQLHNDDTATAVLSISTESRDLPPEAAAANVSRCIAGLVPLAPGALLFKKIDSAARGAFTAEIEAGLSSSGATLALATPALPAEGRTVSDGVLSIRDWAGQNTTIDLREMFANTSGLGVLGVSFEDNLFRSMERAIESGTRILLCDAGHQADLDRLAAAALRLPQPVLWAGSAGLARALAAQLPAQANILTPLNRHAGRALLFTGTPHPVTALQVAHLERALRGMHFRAIHRLAETGASPEQVISAFHTESPAALILTGGDTASFVLRALGADSIRLAGEVAPGIPWGIIEGGVADGRTVVTKSGGFGERDALVRAFEFCESEVGPAE